MKKIIILTVVLATAFSMYAQRPAAGDVGFTFGIRGLADLGAKAKTSQARSLLFRYYLADDMAVRLGARLAMESSTATDDQTTTSGFLYTDKVNSSEIAIAVGIQKSLGSHDRLEPYVGADLSIGMSGSGYSNRTEVTDATRAGGTVGDFAEMVVKNGSGLMFGITPLIGFNFFFTENFAFGAEFGWGLGINSQGSGTSTTTVKVGSNETSTEVETGKLSEMSIGKSGKGQFTASVFF